MTRFALSAGNNQCATDGSADPVASNVAAPWNRRCVRRALRLDSDVAPGDGVARIRLHTDEAGRAPALAVGLWNKVVCWRTPVCRLVRNTV